MERPYLEFDQRGARVRVRVKTRASQSRVLGVKGGELEVAVAAPPVNGAANAELLRTVAEHFGVPKSTATIESGATSRSKLVRLSSLKAGGG